MRHVILTHLDLDHAGGLSDFPQAQVHVSQVEHAAAMARDSLNSRGRYKPAQWAHGPRWVTHLLEGERWFGFDAVRPLAEHAELASEVLLIPLRGHTSGHCGVAVRGEAGWLLHGGDAFFHRDELDPAGRRCPAALAAFQSMVQVDGPARWRNQARLAQLAKERAAEVKVFCAHDPVSFAQFG